MGDGLIGFLFGVFVGGSLGVFFMALVIAAREADWIWGQYEWRERHGEDDKR